MIPRVLAALLAWAAAAPAAAEPLAERMPACLACHGETGRSTNPEVPSLGGQPAPFLLIQIYLFREKQRVNEVMNALAAEFTDDDLRGASELLARLPPPAPEEPADAGRMTRAAALSAKHRCNFCHKADYSGQDHIPRLGGQREDYLVKSLGEYRSGARVGYDPAMVEIAKGLPDADLAELAYFLARVR